MKILVTGVAGFIGYHTCLRLLQRGDKVYGIDNINSSTPKSLKLARLELLKKFPEFVFEPVDITDGDLVEHIFNTYPFRTVIHLAGQAGVRSSMTEPMKHIQNNLVGFANILDQCRQRGIWHLLYASSSSVYGYRRDSYPQKETDRTDHPMSLYAATKKANEVMADSYAHLFGMSITGMRFFTVYGPWGRPDMAVWQFTKDMLDRKEIVLYKDGDMYRDFTYIDDAVECILRFIDNRPRSMHKIINVGGGKRVKVREVVGTLASLLDEDPIVSFKDKPLSDVITTCADTSRLYATCGYVPDTPMPDGLEKWVEWYLGHDSVVEGI